MTRRETVTRHQRLDNATAEERAEARAASTSSRARRRIAPTTVNIARQGPHVIIAVTRHYSGEMSMSCEHCGAKFWQDEKGRSGYTTCCALGSVVIPPLAATPPELLDLLTHPRSQAKHFRENLRAFNSVFAFTSVGVDLDHTVANNAVGAYCFRVHGQVYHRIGSLFPDHGQAPKFLQIYIFDTQHELENRLNIFQNLDRNTLIGMCNKPIINVRIQNINTLLH